LVAGAVSFGAMSRYVALLRGINVGGRNSVPMVRLRAVLEELGFADVATYIASGNVILDSLRSADETGALIEEALPRGFALDERVRVLVLSQGQLQAIVDDRPEGFGSQPDRYHSDVIFLMGIKAAEAMALFDPRQGVDAVWPGDGVIYSQRLSAERTRSRLNKVMGTPAYRSMTIRNWTTTTTLLAMLRARDASSGA
jgi:uncharacterized protein (DUF1697 family)